MERFRDRVDAGRALGRRLAGRGAGTVDAAGTVDPAVTVVLGLPRGGVPVAAEVAGALGAPLDVIVVRKLGLPGHSEVAMGAIGEGGVRVLDERIAGRFGITDEQIERVEREQQAVLEQRSRALRGDAAELQRAPDLTGRTALIVDDGIATGSTVCAAVLVARAAGALRVVVAVPVGPPGDLAGLTGANAVVCLDQPDDFVAVGRSYDDFAETSDDEVVAVLAAHRRSAGT